MTDRGACGAGAVGAYRPVEAGAAVDNDDDDDDDDNDEEGEGEAAEEVVWCWRGFTKSRSQKVGSFTRFQNDDSEMRDRRKGWERRMVRRRKYESCAFAIKCIQCSDNSNDKDAGEGEGEEGGGGG